MEETPPAREQEQEQAEAGARQSFLWALVAGVVPVCGLPVVWTLTAMTRRSHGSPAYQRWYRRLVALAILDTLVAVAVLHLGGMVWRKPQGPAKPFEPPKVLGVVIDPEYPGPGLRLAQVDARGPAASAGLQVGDVVHRAEGQPVDSSDALREAIQAPLPGGVVRLEVERDGARREVGVQPVEASSLAPPPRGLFEPQATGEPLYTQVPRKGWMGTALAMVSLLVLWIVGRRRGADARPIGVMVTLVVAALCALATVRGLSALLGGPSRGVALLSIWAQGLGVVLVAAALVRRGVPEAEAPEARSWFRIYLVSVGLLITLGVRTMMLMAWASQVFEASPEQNQHPIMELARQGTMGGTGWVLIAVPAALLAPVGEELLFRGVLLPWLSGWMGRMAALIVSAGIFASLHLFYGVFTGWILFLGLLLGWARQASGGLRAPILLHVTINSFALLMLARSLTG